MFIIEQQREIWHYLQKLLHCLLNLKNYVPNKNENVDSFMRPENKQKTKDHVGETS